MCYLRWRLLLLLLMLILLLSTLPKTMHARPLSHDVKALIAFKAALGNPPVLRSWLGKEPCRDVWFGLECVGTLENPNIISLKLSGFRLSGVISPALQNLTSLTSLWLDDNRLRGYIPAGLGKLKNLTSLRLANNNLSGNVPVSLALLPKLKELTLTNNQLQGSFPFNEDCSRFMNVRAVGNDELCSRTGSFNLSKCRPSSVPSLASGPPRLLSDNDSGISKSQIAAIAGGAGGAVVIVGIAIALICYFWIRAKRLSSRSSETALSEPSVQGPHESPLAASIISLSEVQGARVFTFSELEQATKHFNQSNLIGQGRFGLVYKGLLYDGIVAIKRRTAIPSQDFANEVQRLSRIRHRHLVSLLGYCQENGHQMLVYDYLPNGSVSSHLYDLMGNSLGKLDFKQRLSIAAGASKGLQYLHNSRPPLIHKDFKTSNVLVDEDFIAKVTDFGLYRLLVGNQEAGASSSVNGFMDPEFNETRRLNEKSDVYSFGVFLLELASGREAISLNRPEPEQRLVDMVQFLEDENTLVSFIDESVKHSATVEGITDFLALALFCVKMQGVKRPTMTEVMEELERIIEKERGLTSSMVEGTTIVTPGSELFKRTGQSQ